MGSILTTKMAADKKVIVEVLLDYDEYVQLKGQMHNVHLFSEDNVEVKANISQRGRNSATKYFLIPKEMRKGMKFTEEVSCTKIETKGRAIFVYTIRKGGI
ncbi:MAG: hypothetical protein KJ955_02850 [Nanoarchaeota archaeon]|nr:hypothetical protein [Nanoarchaeota archaeon]